jgi:hypothetical protein
MATTMPRRLFNIKISNIKMQLSINFLQITYTVAFRGGQKKHEEHSFLPKFWQKRASETKKGVTISRNPLILLGWGKGI